MWRLNINLLSGLSVNKLKPGKICITRIQIILQIKMSSHTFWSANDRDMAFVNTELVGCAVDLVGMQN